MLPMVAPNAARRTSNAPEVAKSRANRSPNICCFQPTSLSRSLSRPSCGSRCGTFRDLRCRRLKNDLLPRVKIGFALAPGHVADAMYATSRERKGAAHEREQSMNGLGGLNKSTNGVVIGLVQLQLPVVATKADLARQTARIVEMVGKA